MSDIVQYAISVVQQFLKRKIALDVFAQNLGGIYIYARQHPEEIDANRLASSLMGPYAEFSGGHVPLEYLREKLKGALSEFQSSTIPRWSGKSDSSVKYASSSSDLLHSLKMGQGAAPWSTSVSRVQEASLQVAA